MKSKLLKVLDNIGAFYIYIHKWFSNIKLNKSAKKIAKKLEIDDRVEKMQETEAFITIKDHKEGFPHSLSCRLINPSKTDIGKISKCILDSIK